jgi:hypothetical protein
MRRVFLILALTCAMAGLTASVVTAAPVKAQALNCFEGGGATCSVSNNNTATLDVPGGGYAGVYVNGKSYSGKPLTAVDFSFTYWGDVGGGSPRLSIPINDGTGTLSYAFIDAAGCGYVSDVTPQDPNTFHIVSTELLNCHVNYLGVDYANWDAFAAANPDFRIANGTLAFVIADQPGHVVIYSVTMR